jgi:hypothetical protein
VWMIVRNDKSILFTRSYSSHVNYSTRVLGPTVIRIVSLRLSRLRHPWVRIPAICNCSSRLRLPCKAAPLWTITRWPVNCD